MNQHKTVINMLVLSVRRQPLILEEGIELPSTDELAVNLGGWRWGCGVGGVEIQGQNTRSFTKLGISF